MWEKVAIISILILCAIHDLWSIKDFLLSFFIKNKGDHTSMTNKLKFAVTAGVTSQISTIEGQTASINCGTHPITNLKATWRNKDSCRPTKKCYDFGKFVRRSTCYGWTRAPGQASVDCTGAVKRLCTGNQCRFAVNTQNLGITRDILRGCRKEVNVQYRCGTPAAPNTASTLTCDPVPTYLSGYNQRDLQMMKQRMVSGPKQWFNTFDVNKDHKITRNEFSPSNSFMDTCDRNHNGEVTFEEFAGYDIHTKSCGTTPWWICY